MIQRAEARWLELDWQPTLKGGLMLRSPIATVTIHPHKWQTDQWAHMIFHRGRPHWCYGSFACHQDAQLDALYQIRRGKLNPADLFPALKDIPW